MINSTVQNHPSSSRRYANRGTGSGFAPRVKAALSIHSTADKAKALEALAKDTQTWEDLFTLSRACDALPPAFQQDVDKALLNALAKGMGAPIPTDLGERDLQALHQFCQRVARPDTGDLQARLHQLFERPIRQRIEALMNQCYGSNHLPIERFLERLAPLGSLIPSLARYIADIQDILDYSGSARATAVAVNNTPAAAVELPPDICHLIALRLLQRVTAAQTRDGFNDSIDDLLNFGLVCKLFHEGAKCAIPQALALGLSFAGLPHWLKAFQAAIDAAPYDTDAPLNNKQLERLNAAQQSVVRGYLKYARQPALNMGRKLEEAIATRGSIAPHTGITHPLGLALIAYAHRVHRFPIVCPDDMPNPTADGHLITWSALEHFMLKRSLPTVGALVEKLIALAVDQRLNRRRFWALSPSRAHFYLPALGDLETSTNSVMKAQPRLDRSNLTSGFDAIAAILLAARGHDGTSRIEQADINSALDFLVHYTALGYDIPASAQEALAQVISHVGMSPEQAGKLRTCLEQANNARPEWS